MKKILSTVVAVMFSTAALAGDFGTASVGMEAKTEQFGVSVATGSHKDFADDSRVVGFTLNTLPVTVGVEMIDKDSNTDYRLSASKKVVMPLGAVTTYGVAEAHYTWGDTYANDEIRLSPYVGVTAGQGLVTPFAEVGYDWKSSKGDFANFAKADSYATVGARVAVNSHAAVVVAVRNEMDSSFNKTDRQAEVKLSVNF